MKLILSTEDQDIISGLYSDIQNSNNISEYLSKFLLKSKLLLSCEYQASLLFPNYLTPVPQVISNNPSDFVESYMNNLMSKDILIDSMMENPREIHYLNTSQPHEKVVNEFLNECHRLRPAGDYCYLPILFRDQIIGNLGYAKPPGEKYSFSDREFVILKMILPVLNLGIMTHATNEKIELNEKLIQNSQNLTHMYLWPNGNLEIPENCNYELISNALQLLKINSTSIKKHPIIKSLIRSLFSSTGKRNLISQTISVDNKSYVIRIFKKGVYSEFKCDQMALISIEEESEIYKYVAFQKNFSLTEREIEIVKSIVCGFSNRDISSKFSIAIATVKKHIANIYEKTKCNSRTQLIMILTSMS